MRKHKKGSEIRRNFTQEEESKIVDLYNSGIGITSICKIIQCSPIPTRNILKKHGIKIRNKEEAHESQKMGIDENYFDVIDNQDKAYILGLLITDGNNCIYESSMKPSYHVHITLKDNDRAILDRIKEKMQIERKIRIITRKSDGKSYARLEIKNKHISLRLNELGIVQNKTFKTTFPDYLSENLIPHFIRGVLDGDGCIPKKLNIVSFAGSTGFITGLAKVIEDKIGYTAHVVNIKHSPGISSIAIAELHSRIGLLNWIYKDADLKLERKYNLYLQMLEKYKEKLVG